MRKFRIIALYLLVGLPLFVLLLSAFTQTRIFRERIRALALNELDSLLNADVQLGELRGDLLTGFSVDSIRVDVDGKPLLRLDRLEVSYNLLLLPRRIVGIRSVTLVRPRVFLFRPRGGEWNFVHMLKPDTSQRGPSSWTVRLRQVEIRNGTVSLCDSTALTRPDHDPPDGRTVEYHAFTLHDLTIAMSAEIQSEMKRVTIQSCSFIADSPDIQLKRFSGMFALSPGEVRVDSLRLTTARSDLAISASMEDVDLAKGIDLLSLRAVPTELSLRANPIDLDELKEFLPPLHFLTGKLTLDLRADGRFGDLILPRADLHFGSSSLFLRGRVINLHDPKDLTLSVKVTESTVVPADIPALMPPLNLPDMSSVGTATLNLEFDGRPADFQTKFLLETPAGSIQSSGLSLIIGGPSRLAYGGDILFSGIDCSRILDDPRMTSNLNGMAKIKGKGIRLHQLASSLVLSIDSSSFRGLPLNQTRLTIEASQRSVTGNATVALGDMHARLQARLTEPENAPPEFHVDGDVTSLNLEDVLHDSTYNSDITMKLNVDGTGLTWNTLSGTMAFDLTTSRYRDYTVTQGDFHLAIDQSDSLHKKLQFESNIADLTVTGAFDLDYLARLVPFEVGNLRAALVEKLSVIDSSFAHSIDRKALLAAEQSLAATPRHIDAHYVLHVKNLEPLSVAAGKETFNGSGVLSGVLKGSSENLAMNADLSVNDFFYGNADSGILVENGKVSLDMQALKPAAPLRSLVLRLETHADKMLVDRREFDTLAAKLEYHNETAVSEAGLTYGKDVRLHGSGVARVTENSVAADVRTLDVGYRDFLWHADSGASVKINQVSAELSGLVMRRDTQTVAVRGMIGKGRSLSGTVSGTHLDLDDLKYLLREEELGTQGKAFAGAADIDVGVSGTLMDPRFTATLIADSVSFRTLPFGRIDGTFLYRDRQITSHVEVRAAKAPPASEPIMSVYGTLPVDLRLAETDVPLPEQPMNLKIVSRGVQMNILDPLLPTFNELRGIMECDLTLAGTAGNPTYDGHITIKDCSFLFVPNNISYTMEATMRPAGDRIRVDDCVIRNLPEDRHSGQDGMIRVGGDFALHGFRPGDFNLTAAGQLLVVKETTRKSSLEVYGDLFVEIGQPPLRFTGEVDNSLLKGSLLIRNSTLIFPPTKSEVADESASSVPVVFVDDTTSVASSRQRSLVARYFEESRSMHDAAGDSTELHASKSFMDGLHYDLDIETSGGNTEIRMIFNPATSEELVATLDGRFNIAEDGKRWTGDLTISRAYYNFIKRFDATGSIRYAGDFLDPELNISATYKGTRTIADTTSGSRVEQIVVTAKITGSRQSPKVEFSMTIDDVDYAQYALRNRSTSNDVQSDAIQFILAGTFPLTTSQKNDLATEMRQTASLSLLTGATSLLTGAFSDFIHTQTGLPITVELSYGNKESTELRLSGTALSGYWRYGGTILNDPLSNANLSILYSLGTIFSNPSLRNLMFELERKTEPGITGLTNDIKRVNSARLFYRFSF